MFLIPLFLRATSLADYDGDEPAEGTMTVATKDTAKEHTDFVTWRLAAWASGLTYEALSADAIRAAKLLLFDSFGCALGGSQQDDVQIALDHFKQMGGTALCTCLAVGF